MIAYQPSPYDLQRQRRAQRQRSGDPNATAPTNPDVVMDPAGVGYQAIVHIVMLKALRQKLQSFA